MCCQAVSQDVVWCGAYRIRWRRRSHVVPWAAASHSDNSCPEFSKHGSPGRILERCVMWRRLQWEGVVGAGGCASSIPDRLRTVLGLGGAAVRAVACFEGLSRPGCYAVQSGEYLPTLGGEWCFHLQGQIIQGKCLDCLSPKMASVSAICFTLHDAISQKTWI